MKKKLVTILIVILAGFTVGYINTLFIYESIWNHFFLGLNSAPWYIHVLYLFIGLFLVIMVHELGHFVSFVRQGIKVKAIYVLCFALVKIDGKWKLKFVPKFLLLLGGIVIPDHLTIDTLEKEEEIILKFRKALIAGPNTSIVYGIAVFVLWLLFSFTDLYWLNGFLFTLMVATTLMTILAVLSSKVSANGLYGDYVAEKELDTNKLFRLTYLTQLVSLIKRDEASLNYLWTSVIEYLDKNTSITNRMYANLLLHYLHETVFEDQIGCTNIDRKIEGFVKRLPKNEDGFITYHHFIYFYYSRGNAHKVNELLNELPHIEFKLGDKVKDFYKHLTNHLLKVSDETAYLTDPKNVVTSSLAWVYAPLELKSEFKEIRL